MSGPYNQQVALGQAGGQTVTQTASTYRHAEAYQTNQNVAGQQQQVQQQTQQQQFQHSEKELSVAPSTQRSAEVHSSRHESTSRRHRRSSGSSRSSSEGAYRLAGANAGANNSSYQHFSAESSYAYGGAANGAAGAYNAGAYSAGAYGAGGNPCGPVTQVEGPRRPGRHQKQVIRLPDQAQGQTRQVRRRLPTPEPDTLERVYIQRVGGEVIEEITEIPTTPPPIVQEKTVQEPAGPPRVVKRTIRVPPRGGNCQPAGGFSGNVAQTNNLLSAGSYGSVQQASGNFQQYGSISPNISGGASFGSGFGNAVGGVTGGAPYGAGFGGAISSGVTGATGSYSPAGSSFASVNQPYAIQNTGFQQQASSYGGGYQQQVGSYGGGYQQQVGSYGGAYQQQGNPFSSGLGFAAQGLAPRAGLQQATCFYV